MTSEERARVLKILDYSTDTCSMCPAFRNNACTNNEGLSCNEVFIRYIETGKPSVTDTLMHFISYVTGQADGTCDICPARAECMSSSTKTCDDMLLEWITKNFIERK